MEATTKLPPSNARDTSTGFGLPKFTFCMFEVTVYTQVVGENEGIVVRVGEGLMEGGGLATISCTVVVVSLALDNVTPTAIAATPITTAKRIIGRRCFHQGFAGVAIKTSSSTMYASAM
jgi:hypothetical protein